MAEHVLSLKIKNFTFSEISQFLFLFVNEKKLVFEDKKRFDTFGHLNVNIWPKCPKMSKR